jgi:hypothetical protein
VPFTVIIFTNFGRYLQNFERYIRLNYYRKLKRYFCCRKRDSIRKTSHILPPITIIQGDSEFDIEELRTEEERQKQRILNADEDEQSESSEDEDQISPMTLVCIVLFYLVSGIFYVYKLNYTKSIVASWSGTDVTPKRPDRLLQWNLFCFSMLNSN